MENNKGFKAKNFLQKLYNFRVKVDRQGKPIANISSIFAAACLIFAPHMTIVGIVAALLLGYQISFVTEDMDSSELEERIRRAAQNVKNGAMNAAKSIQTEIDKAKAQKAQVRTQAEAETEAEKIVKKAAETMQQAAPSNDELLQDLKERDYNDSHREVAPLKPAEDAVILDSSDLTLEQVVDRVVVLARAAAAKEA